MDGGDAAHGELIFFYLKLEQSKTEPSNSVYSVSETAAEGLSLDSAKTWTHTILIYHAARLKLYLLISLEGGNNPTTLGDEEVTRRVQRDSPGKLVMNVIFGTRLSETCV